MFRVGTVKSKLRNEAMPVALHKKHVTLDPNGSVGNAAMALGGRQLELDVLDNICNFQITRKEY